MSIATSSSFSARPSTAWSTATATRPISASGPLGNMHQFTHHRLRRSPARPGQPTTVASEVGVWRQRPNWRRFRIWRSQNVGCNAGGAAAVGRQQRNLAKARPPSPSWRMSVSTKLMKRDTCTTPSVDEEHPALLAATDVLLVAASRWVERIDERRRGHSADEVAEHGRSAAARSRASGSIFILSGARGRADRPWSSEAHAAQVLGGAHGRGGRGRLLTLWYARCSLIESKRMLFITKPWETRQVGEQRGARADHHRVDHHRIDQQHPQREELARLRPAGTSRCP